MVQPRFDLKPETAHRVWLDLVLRFMSHRVLLPHPEIWGSDEGCSVNERKVACNMLRMKTALALQGPCHSPGLLLAPVFCQHPFWKGSAALGRVPEDFL